MLASRQTIVIAGFVFPVVVLTVLLFTGLRLTAALTSDAANPLKILVRGEQWWWRVSYTLPDGGAFCKRQRDPHSGRPSRRSSR